MSLNEANRAVKLNKLADKIKTEHKTKVIEIPEYLVRPEWLVAFNDLGRKVVNQWLKNVLQTPRQIGEAIGESTKTVSSVMSLEAFTLLERHLTHKKLQSYLLPAVIILGDEEMINGANPVVRKDIAKTFLFNEGVLKQEQAESVIKNELVISPEKLEELRKKAEKDI
jgi:hypothetical protein